MTLYFAYGANIDERGMRRRCPGARALGPASLEAHRFFIGLDGWGSVRLSPGDRVHGILWRVTPRDLASLHAYELVHKGLYRPRYRPVRYGARCVRAMIYELCRQATGLPKPGYVEQIVVAARRWDLPESYIRSLERWSTSRRIGQRAIDVGEMS